MLVVSEKGSYESRDLSLKQNARTLDLVSMLVRTGGLCLYSCDFQSPQLFSLQSHRRALDHSRKGERSFALTNGMVYLGKNCCK